MRYIEKKIKRIPLLSFLKGKEYVMYVGPHLTTLQLTKLRHALGTMKLLYLPQILEQLSASVIKYNFPGVGVSDTLTVESVYGQIRQAAGSAMSPGGRYILRYKEGGYVFFDAGDSFSLLESYLNNLSLLEGKVEQLKKIRAPRSQGVVLHNSPTEFKCDPHGGIFSFLSTKCPAESSAVPRPRPASRKKTTKELVFDAEMQAAVDEAHEVIKGLLLKGCPPELLVALINQNVKLSRLRITKKYKIHLVDYDNVEIKLSPLPKTVFLFFLRHPEGVMFSHLQDYRQELLDIYGCICTNDDPEKMNESINRLVDPYDNSISEKCAAVKKAFLLKITDNIASNYYISGNQGEKKGISLDRSLVDWECSI